MPWNDDAAGYNAAGCSPFGLVRQSVVVLWLAFGVSACASARSPSAPDPGRSPFLGTWTGTITSEAIGAGAATLVIDSQVGSSAAPLLTGRWLFVFPNQAFSTEGALSGGLDAAGAVLGLFFDRSAVPCPGEPDGIGLRAIAASLAVTGDRLRGSYVAGGCPGGMLDLARR